MTEIPTQTEILARIDQVDEDDFFGFRTQVLVRALTFEHARPWLNDDVTAEQWAVQSPTTPNAIRKEATDYYEFALTKIQGHRGMSAHRNIDKLTEYAWLLRLDDVVVAMDAADFTQYGAPKVKAFADGMGLPWPDDEDLVRMVAGLPCTDECEDGCSR